MDADEGPQNTKVTVLGDTWPLAMSVTADFCGNFYYLSINN